MNKTTSKKDWDGAVLESGVSEENMLNTMNKFLNIIQKPLLMVIKFGPH